MVEVNGGAGVMAGHPAAGACYLHVAHNQMRARCPRSRESAPRTASRDGRPSPPQSLFSRCLVHPPIPTHPCGAWLLQSTTPRSPPESFRYFHCRRRVTKAASNAYKLNGEFDSSQGQALDLSGTLATIDSRIRNRGLTERTGDRLPEGSAVEGRMDSGRSVLDPRLCMDHLQGESQ